MTHKFTNNSREKTCSSLGQETKHNPSLKLLPLHAHFINHFVY
jgi:hypothetical protein